MWSRLKKQTLRASEEDNDNIDLDHDMNLSTTLQIDSKPSFFEKKQKLY